MSNERSTFTAAELIPEFWDLTAETVEDIVFLGKVTIREMIRSWRNHAEMLSGRIKKTDEEFEFLRGKKARNIRVFAVTYENPQFTPDQIGVRRDSWSRDLEPLDEASKERKRGSTTFNICGWCKFAGGGTGRYDYFITTYCGLVSDADGWHDTERRFNTPCFLREADDLVFVQLRLRLAKTRNRLIREKRETDAKIKFLLRREKLAAQKPALPSHRPYNWFNTDDPVVCYIGGWERVTIWKILGETLADTLDRLDILRRLEAWLRNKLAKSESERSKRITRKQWVTATVIPGYRHHDGCVSVRCSKRVHNGNYLEGHGGGYGMSRPEVMHFWELGYLQQNPDFAEVWAKSASPYLEDFDPEQLLKTLPAIT